MLKKKDKEKEKVEVKNGEEWLNFDVGKRVESASVPKIDRVGSSW